ncbi:MAG: helix-turn-helix domain-containing protein [Candidatus Paceibacterota bacterium]
MARHQDKDKAIKLRLSGYSYSQIKKEINVSKSTLSNWLSSYSLSVNRLKELRDNNEKRIEKTRNTKKLNKLKRLEEVYFKTKLDIGILNDRDVFLGGLFLYWAEGYKTAPYTTAVGNTDPDMLKFFIKWLKVVDAPLYKIKVRIHMYQDMKKEEVIGYWKSQLNLPASCFGQVYIKTSKLSGLSYKNGFGHGTCNIIIHNRDLNEYVLTALKYLRKTVS